MLDQRFQALMSRHRERIYVWEKQKRLVQDVPARDIELWLSKVCPLTLSSGTFTG